MQSVVVANRVRNLRKEGRIFYWHGPHRDDDPAVSGRPAGDICSVCFRFPLSALTCFLVMMDWAGRINTIVAGRAGAAFSPL